MARVTISKLSADDPFYSRGWVGIGFLRSAPSTRTSRNASAPTPPSAPPASAQVKASV